MTKKKAQKTLARKIAGRTYHVDVSVHVAADGEEIIQARDLTKADLSIAAVIAGEGPVLGETFSWMRRALGLQARQLAELLDVRPESVSRWERGERPMDRAAWLLLAGVVLDRVGLRVAPLEWMAKIAATTQPPRLVDVDASDGR